jgi:hypothetical protein
MLLSVVYCFQVLKKMAEKSELGEDLVNRNLLLGLGIAIGLQRYCLLT